MIVRSVCGYGKDCAYSITVDAKCRAWPLTAGCGPVAPPCLLRPLRRCLSSALRFSRRCSRVPFLLCLYGTGWDVLPFEHVQPWEELFLGSDGGTTADGSPIFLLVYVTVFVVCPLFFFYRYRCEAGVQRAGFAPLAITLTAVVYLQEPGAGGA